MTIARHSNAPVPFLLGANLPWVHYGIDFGANAWRPLGGLACAEYRTELDTALDRLDASGVRYVRWFLLCDGRAGIQFSERGRPHALDSFVLRDIDAALEVCNRHRIRVMFVLFDFLWCDTARTSRGVQMGGRSGVLRDPEAREALLETVVQPVLERYGEESSIFAWDIINEPEWIENLTRDELRAFLADCVSLVHASTLHPVTVGSAGVRWRDFYRGLDLDFYQVHWYDSLKHQPSLDTPVDRLGFDRPVLLGEFPTRGSRRSPDMIIDAARAAGYTGAFYWSLLSKDEYSQMEVTEKRSPQS